MTSMTREEMYEMNGLLHHLWSKSGTPAYDKKEWGRLEALVGKSICTMLGPEAERGGYMNLITPAPAAPAAVKEVRCSKCGRSGPMEAFDGVDYFCARCHPQL